MSEQKRGNDERQARKYAPTIVGFGTPTNAPAPGRPITAEVAASTTQQTQKAAEVVGQVAEQASTQASQGTDYDALIERLFSLDPAYRQSVSLDFQEAGQPEVPADSPQALLALAEKAKADDRLGQLAASIRRAEYIRSLIEGRQRS